MGQVIDFKVRSGVSGCAENRLQLTQEIAASDLLLLCPIKHIHALTQHQQLASDLQLMLRCACRRLESNDQRERLVALDALHVSDVTLLERVRDQLDTFDDDTHDAVRASVMHLRSGIDWVLNE